MMERKQEPSLHDVWQKALVKLESRVSQATYHSLLRGAKPLRVQGDALVLAVPNGFVKEWLEERYKEVIESALEETWGQPLRASFEVQVSQLELPLEFGGGEESVQTAMSERSVEPVGAGVVAEGMKGEGEQDVGGRVGSSVELGSISGLGGVSVPLSGREFEEFSPIPLNLRYTFERFVVGRSNSLSHAAAWSVAHHPAEKYNPLFVYGGVGLGKTHLMQAIGHKVKQVHPELKVACVSGETFLYHVVTAIREDRMAGFRRAYRSVEVWLVDDIQFIASAERTEVEFFHIFNELYDTNRQIVICSDRPPKELNLIEGRLRSRFEWGLITDIAPPDLEHRIAILQRKAQEEGVRLPDDVALYMAQAIQNNIRGLEGALTRVVAHASLVRKPISLEVVKECLRDYCEYQPRTVTLKQIQKVVAEHFDVSVEELSGKRRSKGLVTPRHIAMYLAREMTSESLPDIGRAFGKDHSSVLYAHQKIIEETREDASLARLLNELKFKLEIESEKSSSVEKL